MTVNGKKPADSAGSGNGRASDLHDSSPSEGSKTAPAIVPDEPVAKAENPSAAVRRPSTRHRSRITNRNKLLPSISGTSVWTRLMRDTMDAMIVHLGGEDQVSETQRTACRRIAVLETELVHMEDAIARLRCEGREPLPEMLDLYARLGNAQRRFCEALGWQRVPREIVPSLTSYLQANKAD